MYKQVTAQRRIGNQPRRGQRQKPIPGIDIVTWLESLPLELAKELALYLPYSDITELCKVSLKLNDICKDPKFWRNKAVVDFGFPPEGFPEDIDTATRKYQDLVLFNNPSSRGPRKFNLFAIYYAIRDTTMLTYILDKSDTDDRGIRDLLIDALRDKYSDLVTILTKYVINRNIRLDLIVVPNLIRYGYDNNLPHLLKQMIPRAQSHMLESLAYKGNLKLVLYLLDQGIISGDFMSKAAEGGQLALIQYLVEHGIMQSGGPDRILLFAATEGHLDIVKYMLEHGATMVSRTLRDMLYAHENNMAPSAEIIDTAKYLIRRGADPNIVFRFDNSQIGQALKGFAEDYIARRVQ